MSNKIIGYSYFGRSRGLQTVNGGGIPSNYPVENIVDLDMQIFEVQPNTRLYRVSRILQGNKMKQFFSIYEYAEEKDSHRTGTFLGATIGLDHSIVSPEMITTCLVGMIEYLSKYLNSDANRKFIISELKEQDLKSPRDFQSLNNVAKNIEFPVGKPKNKSSLTSLRKSHELLDANAFFYHALNQSELYDYGELYATADEKIILKSGALYSLNIDLHFDSAIGQKLTLLEGIEQKRNSITQEILKKEKAYKEKEESQILKLNEIEELKDKINSEVDSLEKEKERIENTLQTRNARLEGLPESIDNLKEEIKDLEIKKGEAETLWLDKSKKADEVSKVIEKKETYLDSLTKDLNKADEDYKEKLKKIEKLQDEITKCEAVVKQKREEFDRIDEATDVIIKDKG